jgi:steroid 5-alpha reductase family enzyme
MKMNKNQRNALVAFFVVVGLGVFVAWAGSQGGQTLGTIPLFALAVGLAFLIQWLVFIPSYMRQTEKFFDLTGSLTYISIVTLALVLSKEVDLRTIVLWALVVIWASRLGTFLFRRIRREGKDDRFDELKPSFLRFLNVWTVQGLWVTFTMAAALVVITTSKRVGFDIFAIIGLLIWIFGFSMEALADMQKNRFNANPANKGKFIQTGLWSRSRHPNYFGEIVIWIGVAVIALPVLQGWQWVALISPLFVTLLLTRVSGVPLLEKKSDAKWGGQPDYEAYKQRTPVLIPRLW